MERRDLFWYVLVAILLLLLYLSFRLVRPFIAPLVLGLILAYALFPLYHRLERRLSRPTLASILMVVLVLVIIIVPSFFLVLTLVKQSASLYTGIRQLNLSALPAEVYAWSGLDPATAGAQAGSMLKTYLVDTAPNLLGSLADIAISAFILFFTLFFAFRDGRQWVRDLRANIPLDSHSKEQLFHRVEIVTRAVIYGQLATAIVQGALGGLLFLLFGVPNALFWGFVMVILSFIPYFGTAIVWLPFGLWYVLHGEYLPGLGIIIFGALVVSNIDNVLRPYLIGKEARLSALLAVLGVFGGLRLFGFIGIILGPLTLALLQTAFALFKAEETESKNTN